MTIKHSGGLSEKQYAHLSWSPKVMTQVGRAGFTLSAARSEKNVGPLHLFFPRKKLATFF